MNEITIASRGSRLALVQDEIVEKELKKHSCTAKRVLITTKGDMDRTTALKKIGGNGLFVREIEAALASGLADAAVHSAKDLPYELSPDMTIGAVVKAADPSDYLVIKNGHAREIKIIGTGSARRAYSIKRLYPDAEIKNIRGNVETRLEKLTCGDYDAIVIAKAGIDRLGIGLNGFTVRRFTPDEMIPACGQGIIAVECRKNDKNTISILKKITDAETAKRFTAERYLFELMKADCSMAVGVHAEISGDRLKISGLFADQCASRSGKYWDYRRLCREIADEIYFK